MLRRTEDLCTQMKEVDKKCPLKEGETTVTKSVDLPGVIPPVSCFLLILLLLGWSADDFWG